MTPDELSKLIPDEVVETAARAMCAGNKWEEPCATPCVDCAGEARAALAAALAAWPDMILHDWCGTDCFILPLTQKDATDE